MPTVVVTLRRAARRPRHRKAVIVSPIGSVTLPITRPDSELSNIAGQWEETPRPGEAPRLDFAGRSLRKQRLEVVMRAYPHLADRGRDSAARRIMRLARLAEGRTPVTVSWSGLEASRFASNSGRWAITSMDVKVSRRRQGDNDPTRALVSLELTELAGTSLARGGRIRAHLRAAMQAAPVADVAPGTARMLGLDELEVDVGGRPRHWVVGAGDDLFRVAVETYGTAEFWRTIAVANGLGDVRRLEPGTVLVLP